MRRRGVTLLELALVLAMLGILAAIAGPRLVAWQDRIVVESAAGTTRAFLDETRGLAIRLARPVELQVVAGDLTVSTVFDTLPVVLRARSLDPTTGITGLARPLGFGADGLAIGVANRTIRLQRGRILREIVVSRLGRIR